MKKLATRIILSLILGLGPLMAKESTLNQFDEGKGVADWLFILNPAKTTFQTDKLLSELSDIVSFYKNSALDGKLIELGINTGFMEVELKNDKATVILFSNKSGASTEAFKLKIKPTGEEGLLEIKVRGIYSHIVELFENDSDDLSRFEFIRKVENLANELLNPIDID